MKLSVLFTLVALARQSTVLASCNTTATYDYVVVGSGPGGGPLAANLAREGYSVFLIEAGEDRGEDRLQQVPRFAAVNAEHPEMSWQFFVSHYTNETQARRDRAFSYRLANGTIWSGIDPPPEATPLGIYYPRGATVGGSAISNAMNFLLPPDSHWEGLAEATGDDSWGPESMREHFRALERNVYVDPDSDSLGHGFDGYISTNLNNISHVVDGAGIFEVIQNAMVQSESEDIGVPDYDEVVKRMQRDLNRGDADQYEVPGVYSGPLHLDENRRRSSPWNIISETLSTQNEDGSPTYPLTLSTNSLATKVLTRHGNGTNGPVAYGVEYLPGKGLYEADQRYDASVDPETKTVFARKEVIISGGAFNTPQLLKLSGIGPREELERHDITVVADLPAVGEYLQDNYEIGVHVNSQVPWENNPLEGCIFNPNATAEEDPCMARWLSGYGGYGDGGAGIYILQRTEYSDTADADIVTFGSGGSYVFNGHYPGFSRARWPPTSFFFAIVGMKYRNPTGTVRLRSSDPRKTPEINFNFYQEGAELDIPVLIQGLEHASRILNASGEPYQPFEVIDPPSDRSLEQHILDHTWSHHALGSCRMGISAADSCVDSNFKVHGIQGLRVVDGSVFREAPGAFPVAPTFLLGQKAFASILRDA